MTHRKRINLALQGGGAHGAFTWGALDRLLEDGRIDIAAISGTSAGAMNAVALADGFVRAGPDGARAVLERFWGEMARSAALGPVQRTPRTAQEIQNRINEISFNASLLKELRAIEFVSRLIREGKLDPAHYRDTHVHLIHNEDALNPLGASSKVNAEWGFLTHLRDIGRDTAAAWLERHFDAIGECSSVDLKSRFLGVGESQGGR